LIAGNTQANNPEPALPFLTGVGSRWGAGLAAALSVGPSTLLAHLSTFVTEGQSIILVGVCHAADTRCHSQAAKVR
jgi:hypothetical protein